MIKPLDDVFIEHSPSLHNPFTHPVLGQSLMVADFSLLQMILDGPHCPVLTRKWVSVHGSSVCPCKAMSQLLPWAGVESEKDHALASWGSSIHSTSFPLMESSRVYPVSAHLTLGQGSDRNFWVLSLKVWQSGQLLPPPPPRGPLHVREHN